MFFSSISRSAMPDPEISPPGRAGSAAGILLKSAQAFGCEFRDGLVVFRRDEAGAGVHVDRRETVDDGFAQAQDRQIALLEGLLVGCELHPAVLEALNDLRAGVEADVDNFARLLACRLHIRGGVP